MEIMNMEEIKRNDLKVVSFLLILFNVFNALSARTLYFSFLSFILFSNPGTIPKLAFIG